MAITDKLAAIGDAIREKTGGTDELTLDQMVTEIGNISGGSTIDFTTIEDVWVSKKTKLPMETYTNARVTKVKHGAFSYLTGIKTVNLPNVTTIGEYAFLGCSLITINAPKVTKIDTRAFSSGYISELNFPLVTTIGDYCFYGSNQTFTTVDLPKLTTIGTNVFDNNKNLVTVNFPILVRLSSYSLRDCSSLKNVNLPKVEYIENNAFASCTALETLDLPSLKELSGWNESFNGCSSLTAFIIRNTTGVAKSGSANMFRNTPIASGTGYIYVPDELVESYKTATNWVTYANQIKPLSEYVEVTE